MSPLSVVVCRLSRAKKNESLTLKTKGANPPRAGSVTLPCCDALDRLEGRHLSAAGEDTEHQGCKGQQGHAEPEVGHAVLPLGLRQPVGQRRLQAHEQHAGGEGDSRSHVVKNFGIVHLSDRHREEEKKWGCVKTGSDWEQRRENVRQRPHDCAPLCNTLLATSWASFNAEPKTEE